MTGRKRKGLSRFGIRVDPAWDVTSSVPDSQSREKVCGEKELLTERDAKTRAALLEAKQRTAWNAYACPYCSYWHVGHSTRAKKPDGR